MDSQGETREPNERPPMVGGQLKLTSPSKKGSLTPQNCQGPKVFVFVVETLGKP